MPPKTAVSVPFPPSNVSLPAPPFSLSLPAPPTSVSLPPPPCRDDPVLAAVRMSLKPEPISDSIEIRVSVPAPIVFCGPEIARLTVTPDVAEA